MTPRCSVASTKLCRLASHDLRAYGSPGADVISNEDLADVVLLGHELDSVEFKGVGNLSDKAFLAKVTRACLGMSNRRDGGTVIVGIEDKNPGASTGLSESQISDWLNYDNVADALHRYADPAIRFELAQRSLPGGAPVAVIEVAEFEEIPTLCRKDYSGVLVTGPYMCVLDTSPERLHFRRTRTCDAFSIWRRRKACAASLSRLSAPALHQSLHRQRMILNYTQSS